MRKVQDTFIRLAKEEGKYLLAVLVVLYIIFQIVFRKENMLVVFRTVLSLFWVFVLPGYMMMLYWKDKVNVLERMVFGSLLSAAVIGIFSYYLGLLGVNVNVHAVILPTVLILVGAVALVLKKKEL